MEPKIEPSEITRIEEAKSATDRDSGTSQTQIQYDAADERRVRRKLDRHIMPLFFVLYMLDSLDRSNIGNAEIAGMAKDLHLSGGKYSWLLTIFYITYIIAEATLLLWKIFPPHMVGAFVIFAWGLVSTLQAAAQSWGGMMALRFLLGTFEAAYAPGIIYLLSFFYLRHEIGFRCGLFVAAAPLAATFSGALAYGITSGHTSLAPWRLLFLVEGLATIVMVPFGWFFIPDSPDKARFLTSEEKQIVKARTVRQVGVAERTGRVSLKEFGIGFIDWTAWFNALMYFGTNVSFSSLPLYLPTILKDMGYTSINAQGLSAPPYFAAFLFALVTTYVADKTQQRGLMLMAISAIGGTGYVILAAATTVGVRYFAVFLAAAGVFSTVPNILAWTLNNQGNDSRRSAGLILIGAVGQCGPLLGTQLYPTNEAPRYIKGMSVCAAFMFFITIMALCLRTLLVWRNRKLDQKYGRPIVDDKSAVGVEDYGPNFRYVL
ncbi:MFS general substrate transporter [Viridothelium virens]|uniref:MFS general substrate transporter n=1 Tax=Viridothelium virens TaxID=1048519 RepID=A0A6A6H6P6_VIRVR|nr:MFS general substrate transporter [Viridothelium virens]